MFFHNYFSESPYVLETVSHLLEQGVQKDLVDFDNYLDDQSQDWTNLGIEKLIASINASNTIDDSKDEEEEDDDDDADEEEKKFR